MKFADGDCPGESACRGRGAHLVRVQASALRETKEEWGMTNSITTAIEHARRTDPKGPLARVAYLAAMVLIAQDACDHATSIEGEREAYDTLDTATAALREALGMPADVESIELEHADLIEEIRELPVAVIEQPGPKWWRRVWRRIVGRLRIDDRDVLHAMVCRLGRSMTPDELAVIARITGGER
ncbi:MAG TPA: hypothetical protein VFT22_07065 [Kofleriaceae bacterium]|nr:hypothetical protein [Kofleriaceae bacterium]